MFNYRNRFRNSELNINLPQITQNRGNTFSLQIEISSYTEEKSSTKKLLFPITNGRFSCDLLNKVIWWKEFRFFGAMILKFRWHWTSKRSFCGRKWFWIKFRSTLFYRYFYGWNILYSRINSEFICGKWLNKRYRLCFLLFSNLLFSNLNRFLSIKSFVGTKINELYE